MTSINALIRSPRSNTRARRAIIEAMFEARGQASLATLLVPGQVTESYTHSLTGPDGDAPSYAESALGTQDLRM